MAILDQYRRYLDHFGTTVPVRELHADTETSGLCALRHDVDYDLDVALEMAYWEHEAGARATYYLLPTAPYWADERLAEKCLQLQDYGHEVGLHINAMAQWAGGETDDPERTLMDQLDTLRQAGVTVTGMAAHGDHPKILDIGCGTGRLAEAIRRVGIRDYEGIDFSGERIKEARRYVPSMKFDIVDVFAEGAEERFRRYDTFIMTEFLEHIMKDLDVIQQIPSGSRVIISVPNFDSAGHVRYFESEDEVIDRYSEYLHMAAEDTTEIRAPKRPEKITWVSHGIRR